MHGGLLCQTDETPDARELYAAQGAACDECVTIAAVRGAATPALERDDEREGEITWLVQAALGADAGADARRRPPLASSPGLARKGASGR
jgi:hypothetical protein